MSTQTLEQNASSGAILAAAPMRQAQSPARDSLWMRALLWTAIAIYILTVGNWAYWKGMSLRTDIWQNSRTIRFHGDISNGINWGSLVLRTEERLLNSTPVRDPANPKAPPHPPTIIARSAPNPNDKNQRPLTFGEVYQGVDQVYQNFVVGESPDGDYGLDYPPMRLLTMTLWTWHVQNQVPNFGGWPGPYHPGDQPHYSATGDRGALVDEDIAGPVLLVNTYCILASAVFSFFLVWVWAWRGGRPNMAGRWTGWRSWIYPRRRLVPWKQTPIRQTRGFIGGLIVFAITCWAFFYGVVIAEIPVSSPPPAVAFAGRPLLSKSADGKISAIITATIDGQGSDAQWHVDWGTTPMYGNQTTPQGAGDEDVAATLRDLPPATTIHYRASARNDRGVTNTADETFNTSNGLAPMPSRLDYGAAWLDWTQWLRIGVIFLMMLASIRYLPPAHRGWACGLVAGLLIWFDPALLIDTHVWPQWDAWVLPPFLLAALLASLDWWFMAGVVLGVGVMFKGQTMVVAPLLFFWPLLGGRWGAIGRMVTGFVLSAGLVLFPWLVLDNGPGDWRVGPLRWIQGLMAAGVIAAALSFYRGAVLEHGRLIWQELKDEWNGRVPEDDASGQRRKAQTNVLGLGVFCASLLLGIIFITLLVLRRWPSDGDLPRIAGLFLLLGILLPPWFLPRRSLGVWMAAILAASIWMSAYLYHGDWTWKTVGFEYGARKHYQMALGQGGMGNLPQIMESRFGWDISDLAWTFHPPDIADTLRLATRGPNGQFTGWVHDWGLDGSPVQLDIRSFLMMVFVVVTILAGIGAAIQARRNDPRVLSAFAAVFVLMPNILCQMAARYQIWGAAISALLIAVSPGLVLLHVVLSILATGMVAAQLLSFDEARSPRLHDLMARFHPDDGWIMLMIGAVFLYVAIAPARRPPREELQLP
ncbi:MAG: hypothetical protein ABSH22_09555 [Tepidisphaeraceae bacterium]|jgi:hypothetical protein